MGPKAAKFPDQAKRLAALRHDCGLTQAEIAARATPICQQPEYERFERGERKIGYDWAKRLAPAFSVHWAVLLGEDVPRLTPDEQALLDNYRGMGEGARAHYRGVGDALAQPAAPKRAVNS